MCMFSIQLYTVLHKLRILTDIYTKLKRKRATEHSKRERDERKKGEREIECENEKHGIK